MSITDNKITRWDSPIVNEADRPQRSASDMKAIFDSNSNQLRTALNNLIDALASGGAEDIGAAVEGMEGQDVETILAELKGLIDSTGEDLDAVRAAVLPEGDGNTFLANNGTWKLPEVGAAANGLPEGGNPGDVLYKNSFTAYDGGWVAPEEAGLMTTAVYDPELTGTVLSAENANKLGGKEAGDYTVVAAAATVLPESGTALTNNTVYHVTDAVTTYNFVPPASGWAHGYFTTGASASVSFSGQFMGAAPSIEANKAYEFDVFDGIWAVQEVVAA